MKNISTTDGSVVMKFGADVHGYQIMNSTNFGDSLTFPFMYSHRRLNSVWLIWFIVKHLQN